MAYLNYTQNMKLGFNELFHLHSITVRDNWFDFVLWEDKRPLVELLAELETSRYSDFLEVEYDNRGEIFGLNPCAGDVGHAFSPRVNVVNRSHLEGACKAEIRLQKTMLLCYIEFPVDSA